MLNVGLLQISVAQLTETATAATYMHIWQASVPSF